MEILSYDSLSSGRDRSGTSLKKKVNCKSCSELNGLTDLNLSTQEKAVLLYKIMICSK